MPKWCVVLLLVVLLFRIMFIDVFILKNVPASLPQDPMEYKILAVNLIEHQKFTQDISDPNNHELLRTPGYPVFMALFVPVDDSGYLVIFVQQILSLLTACMIYFIVYRLISNKKIAGIASLIFFLWPYDILWSRMTMSETLFTFLLVATTCVILFRRGWRSDIVAGLLTGMAIYVRPQGVLAFGVIWFVTFFQGFAKRIWLYPLIVFLCLAPWLTRNYLLTNSFVFSSSGDYNMVFSGIAGVDAESKLQSYVGEKDSVVYDDIGAAVHRNWSFSAEAYPTIEKIIKNSNVSELTVVKENLVCAKKVWSLNDFDMLLRRFPNVWKMIFLSAYFLFLIFCSLTIIFGFCVALFKRKIDRLTVFILTVGVVLFGTFVNMCVSSGRMTIPLLPFVLTAVALGLDEMIVYGRKYIKNKV